MTSVDLGDVTAAVATAVAELRAGRCSAVACVGEVIAVGTDWWTSTEDERILFETELAAHGGTRALLLVPMQVGRSEAGFSFSPYTEPAPGSEPELFIVALDLASGVDMLRAKLTVGPGTVEAGDIEIFQGHGQLSEQAPGWHLVQALLAA